MIPIIYLAFLMSSSALSNCEGNHVSVWMEPQISSQSEMSYSLMKRYREDILSKRPNIITCCVCQEFVRRAKEKVKATLQKKITHICYKYLETFRKMCLKRAIRYLDILLHKLFPGGTPRNTCQKMKLCS